jgi:hypothetical protein
MATTALREMAGLRPHGFRAAQRLVAEALQEAQLADGAGAGTLESLRSAPGDPPRLANVELIEDDRMKAHQVGGEPLVGFAAFLDGLQVSRIVALHEGLPIVLGSIGAVVRARVDRRLGTWRSEFEERLYAPRGFLTARSDAALGASGIIVADTTPRKDGLPDESGRHPLSLSDVAVSAVQAHRESLELSLAEAWLREREAPLYIDGGISGSSRAAASPHAVGVVKTHRTLYGDAAAVRLILGLDAGERSTVFAVSSANGWRATFASWYLRLRTSSDPLWGLVRVETCHPERSEGSASGPALSGRADQISRWILAEAAPLALPDGRWDTMAYGVRDCQQYLKAILK